MPYNYIVNHIPKNTQYNRRPAYPMTPEYLTLHNTGNPESSVKDERGWLTNPSNKRTASYHHAVDEHDVVECLHLNESSWNAGDGKGNRKSISIEIGESVNYQKTLRNTIELCAKLLHELNWGVGRMKRHFDWSSKVCHRLMYDNGKWTGWYGFVGEVQKELDSLKRKANTNIKGDEDTLNLDDYKTGVLGDALETLNEKGWLYPKWAEKARKKELTVSELLWLNTVVLSRALDKKEEK
ncbi:N-acetylmuramoyl-L-alanine amidase family protein [Cytobacillus sp. IB215665]|uniref:peptidoglycan recognition protein family protein n=1 Tax=Cytobacillus sp. IB215665 TaxID=3097357 RepID=UPI002A16C438|nr:N-acetylmuramoyl-L-alanine amidase [Cytobacillus sp. IB215665]MDX8365488.1 N-acetylmuramoyl-L-alanine amidase [Cytobacillus sp. IB215665]